MRNTVVKVLLTAALVVSVIVAFPGEARAVNACYQFIPFTSERWVLNVADSATLLPGQVVFKVHGKETGGCGTGSASGVYGTVLVNKGATQPDGAHMSIQDMYITPGCRPLLLDCTSTETVPTPATWECQDVLLFGEASTGTASLTKIPTDAACQVFQDIPDERGSSSTK
jgi:hypothetical protein